MNQSQDPLAAEPQVPQGRLEQATGFNPWELAGITAGTLAAGVAGKKLYNKVNNTASKVKETAGNLGKGLGERFPKTAALLENTENMLGAPVRTLKNAAAKGADINASILAEAAAKKADLLSRGYIQNLVKNPEALQQLHFTTPVTLGNKTIGPEQFKQALNNINMRLKQDSELIKGLETTDRLSKKEQQHIAQVLGSLKTPLDPVNTMMFSKLLDQTKAATGMSHMSDLYNTPEEIDKMLSYANALFTNG